jgi:hypothetical protein
MVKDSSAKIPLEPSGSPSYRSRLEQPAQRLRVKCGWEKAGRPESPRAVKNGGTKRMRRIERMLEPLGKPLLLNEPSN